jgi:lysophospholipase L1-like esterase
MRLKNLSHTLLIAAAAVALGPTLVASQPAPAVIDTRHLDPQRYAKQIGAYVADDQQHMPERCQILFLGSASIAIWKTMDTDLSPAHVIGRGFGGSTIADQIYYFDKIATPYHPRAIFLYIGENDVSNGLEPAEIMQNMNQFLKLKTERLGAATPVYYISIKPSPTRLADLPGQERVNELAKALASKRKDFHYIDVARDVWEPTPPNPVVVLVSRKLKDFYRPDGIHLTQAGYDSWINTIKPVVMQESQRPSNCSNSSK